MKQSVLIIGAGLGGLFAGAILAKEGLSCNHLREKQNHWRGASRLSNGLVRCLTLACTL